MFYGLRKQSLTDRNSQTTDFSRRNLCRFKRQDRDQFEKQAVLIQILAITGKKFLYF